MCSKISFNSRKRVERNVNTDRKMFIFPELCDSSKEINSKVEKILKNSLDLIPSVRIQIIGGKFTEGESDGIKCRLPFNFFLLYKSVLELSRDHF